jgi:DNA polymerase
VFDAHHDFETGSAIDLRKAGVHRYAEHPSTRIWCMSWWFAGTYQMNRWWPGAPDPTPLLDHVARGGRMGVHNAIFERTIWNVLIRGRYCPHWPELRIEQQNCTMARAATVSIPQSLEVVGKVVGAKAEKDMEGNALMMKLTRPRRVEPDGTLVWWDTPENLARVMSYCDQDVVTETEIDGLLPPLSAAEFEVWALDQRINDRGIQLDIDTIHHAIKVRDIAKVRLNKRMAALTNGAVGKCTEVAKLVSWVQAQGVPCESVAKGEQAEILLHADAEKMPQVREAIELRQDASKTSTAKFDAMLNVACADGRARGLLAFHGASSGRWAGRLIQPQNLYRIDPERDGDDIQRAVEILLTHTAEDAHDMLSMLFGSAMVMLAKTLRTMIVAAPHHILHGTDLANIEGRLQAWIAGEEWKLDAFRAFDAKTGPDLYCVAYGKAFGEDPAAVKKQAAKRQIGKVMELALGYQGSVGSFISMGKNYNLKPAPLVPVIEQVAPEKYLTWRSRYANARDKRGLPEDQWAAVKTIVTGWREQHPRIVQSWWDVQDAAVEAVASPGQFIPVLDGKVAYLATKSFLYCRLPSGRVLAYCNPRLVVHEETWIELPDGATIPCDELFDFEIAAHLAAGAVRKSRVRKRVDYEGYDGEHRRWTTFSLYGGMQFNHIVQGTARDVMVGGMMRAEQRGYTLVLTVHDEVLCETPDWFGSPEELEAIMTEGEVWLHGCPLAAKGWSGVRYGK